MYNLDISFNKSKEFSFIKAKNNIGNLNIINSPRLVGFS
jgi:hypothetical protein